MKPQGVENDHNVYVLGAGFSAGRGIPMIATFLNHMRDALDVVKNEQEQRAIEEVLRFRREAAAASERVSIDIENVEELFSLALVSGEKATADAIPLAIAATIRVAHARFDEPMIWLERSEGLPMIPPSWCDRVKVGPGSVRPRIAIPLYELYLATILGLVGPRNDNARDTIISFNYDEVVEEAAERLGLSIWYGLSEESVQIECEDRFTKSSDDPRSLRLLKLHGSVNWSTEVAKSENRTRCLVFKDYQSLRSNGSVPALIPPVRGKAVPALFEHIWKGAIDAFRTATRIAIIGYSLRPADEHFKFLLAAGLKDNICLRRIEVIDNARLEGAGTYGPHQEAMEQRVGALLRPHHIEGGRVQLSMRGARSFFRETLPHFGWNRRYHEGLSFSDN